MNLPRLLRTLWYVPPQAVLWRLWVRARRRYYALPFYDVKRVWEAQGAAPLALCGVQLMGGHKANGLLLERGAWVLAGKEEPLGLPPRTWLPAKLQALQVFELHYHEWLADLQAADKPDVARQLIGDWLEHFAHYHPLAWHPYPLSLRVVAWLTHGRWLLAEADDDFRDAFYTALRAQILFLRPNCEWDLGGNHLIKNLKALVMGGVAMGDVKLITWAATHLSKAFSHQVLPDGAHDERSPHYHAQVLQDVLELRAALRNADYSPQNLLLQLESLAPRMGAALAFYTYPDGALGLWNDGAEGDKSRLTTLLELADALPPPTHLPDAGYAKLEAGLLGVMLDAGKGGPDENPGHAHADTLAFELWLGKQRVVVNQGTLAYQHPLRQHFRSTAAHSTLQVQNEELAEVWDTFRVGRRPRQVGFNQTADSIRAWHDGYKHLKLQHTRTLHLLPDGSALHGTDEVKGPTTNHRLWLRFHLHPTISVQQETEQTALLTLPNGKKIRFTCAEGGRLTLQPARYAPQFNQLQESQQLAVRLTTPKALWMFEFLK